MFAPLILIQAITAPAEIDRLIEAHLHAPIGATGGAEAPVDPRLRLARCDEAPTLTTTARGDSVTVRCPDGWRLSVRVAGGRPTIGEASAKDAPTVRRGQEVAIRLSGVGFWVGGRATALEDGATGGWVRVRRGRDTVRGRVAADGTLELSPTP